MKCSIFYMTKETNKYSAVKIELNIENSKNLKGLRLKEGQKQIIAIKNDKQKADMEQKYFMLLRIFIEKKLKHIFYLYYYLTRDNYNYINF